MGILAFLSLPGGMEWLIILAVLVLVFAPKFGAQIIRSISQSVREVNDLKSGVEEEIHKGVSDVLGDSKPEDADRKEKKPRPRS